MILACTIKETGLVGREGVYDDNIQSSTPLSITIKYRRRDHRLINCIIYLDLCSQTPFLILHAFNDDDDQLLCRFFNCSILGCKKLQKLTVSCRSFLLSIK